MVKVNGKFIKLDGRTISEYLTSASYDITRVAVERNGEIVPKSMYEKITLCDGDTIEVVSFVGGG